MRDALVKDSRIHRDISIGNIILVKETDSPVRRGYLVDWETSCKVDDTGIAEEAGRVVSRSFSLRIELSLMTYGRERGNIFPSG